MKQIRANYEPVPIDGWNQLQEIALCGPQEIRRWETGFPASHTKRKKFVTIQGPRVTTSFKSKLGTLLVYYDFHEADMAVFERKLTPRAYKSFVREIREQLNGMAKLITGASKVTCQVTGRMGAGRFIDDQGVVLTVHPDTIRDMKLKPWKGKRTASPSKAPNFLSQTPI